MSGSLWQLYSWKCQILNVSAKFLPDLSQKWQKNPDNIQ